MRPAQTGSGSAGGDHAGGLAGVVSAGSGPVGGGRTGDTGADLAVRTSGLTKRFRSGQVAVVGIDLEVPRGAVYGFLGPNGSGKTTTIRMLLGLTRPTSGRAWLLGSPMPEDGGRVLPRVGALVEGPAFQPYLSGRANLARLDAADATADPRTTRRRSDAALERVGLGAAADKRYRQYSLGMKQRLGLAAALLRPRDLLVLDEPTNGLDPQGTREVRHLVRDLAQAGTTVLVSSHLLAEIEQVCSHVGIMSRGRLLLQGERDALTARGEARVEVTVRATQAAQAGEVLRAQGLAVDGDVGEGTVGAAGSGATTTGTGPGAAAGPGTGAGAAAGDASPRAVDEAVTIEAPADGVAPEKVAAALVHAGVDVLGLAVRRPSLEQVFVELTGEGFDVAR